MASVAATSPPRPRRFAPLRQEPGTQSDAPSLQGIVFDVDGTLCLPQHYMFSQMRAALGIDRSVDILDHIRSLPTETERTEAVAKIQAIEREAMLQQQPQPGLVQLMDYLEERGMRRALSQQIFRCFILFLLTPRTSRAPVTHLLQNHLPKHVFEPIITRDTPDLLPKPDPAGILHIARQWGLDNRAESMIMVGNIYLNSSLVICTPYLHKAFLFVSGHAAGAATVLLLNDRNAYLKEHPHTDLCINRLDDLIEILDRGFVGQNHDHSHE
ncbi:HAD superfamily hydrolase [Rasamsonia emersonii CBS 393.64]|uniref:HAD superfamily hydrolase n=1 Tax=Rasamsonia emersonii (strain ATCC 16479 / CBS 393.64 / IMI 116815) TaxID=1408163 RepID=A0A0F4YQK0_RASE3|nr:HAD superfamily hydrolase [Rasamsonia emersonii CBS 393.64]KKA19903.1 HAD superfamily hydrolase [Rasamsonia emersonii CBS 393.64]